VSALPALSDLQLAVMRVLWDKGEASAADVHHALRRSRPMAITTVATLLLRLEKRAMLSHRADGRSFIYRPRVSEREVRRSMLAGIVENVFRGDPAEVVQHLLSSDDVSAGDIRKIRELVDSASKSSRPPQERARGR
jgi:BlaI family transcriptional regulator, penicillinase repressor